MIVDTININPPTCVIGIPCGNSCISSVEICHIGVTVLQQPTERGPEDFARPNDALVNTYYIRASEFSYYGSFKRLSRDQYQITVNDRTIVFVPGSDYAFLDEKPIKLNSPPVFYQTYLFIPLKAVNLLGCQHDALEKKSDITMKCSPDQKPRDIEWAFWAK